MDPKQKLCIRSLSIDWDMIGRDSYLRNIASLKGLDELEFNCPVTFFVGENGSGKSTLLEGIAIAYGFNPEGGTLNYSFSTYNSHSELHEAIRLTKGIARARWGYFYRAESFYNVATAEDEYGHEIGGRPLFLHQRSHGESFVAMAVNNFNGNGLYILDEPEAALSPQRQLTLLYQISECAKQGAQFIIATHSPILLGLPGAEILTFDDGKLHLCSYEETDSYKVTETFINDRERLLNALLK
ncbi:MAG: AAA family ATPase [Lachnospiraceae bacterium]|nr:AAA family ATPase [Lachnospiraceae bacterium]